MERPEPTSRPRGQQGQSGASRVREDQRPPVWSWDGIGGMMDFSGCGGGHVAKGGHLGIPSAAVCVTLTRVGAHGWPGPSLLPSAWGSSGLLVHSVRQPPLPCSHPPVPNATSLFPARTSLPDTTQPRGEGDPDQRRPHSCPIQSWS